MVSPPGSSATAAPDVPRLSVPLPGTQRLATSAGAEQLLVESPLTGLPLGNLPLSTPADVRSAMRVAALAQRTWAQTPLAQRCQVLDRFHDLIAEDHDLLLNLIQLESGKTRLNAFEEVASVMISARHYARAAKGYLAPHRDWGLAPVLTSVETRRIPWGVVGIVTPWNFPLTLPIGDTLPALIAGNGVILRPDPQATFTALAAVELLDQAGLPPGLLQIVSGEGPTVGEAVVRTADYVAYTGSTETGRHVGRVAAGRLIGASLELGGKNSLYVRADADLDLAVDGALRSCFNSAGQVCVSTERLLLHERIADDFLARFVPATQRLRIGTELAFGPDLGSLAGQRQLDRVTEHVRDAVAKGAAVLAGGRARPELGRYVFEATLLDGVSAAMTCRDTETFGPVAAVYRVADDDAAVRLANDTDYGLHATIFSRDLRAARRVAGRLAAGSVSINETYVASWAALAAPMGGMRGSGLGRRHGPEGLLRFTQAQAVTLHRGPPLRPPPGASQGDFATALRLGLSALKKLGLK